MPKITYNGQTTAYSTALAETATSRFPPKRP